MTPRGTTAPPAPSKTTMVPTMRAMIVTTCVVLGTLAVLSGGRGSSSRRRHTHSGGLAAVLLRKAHDTSYDYDPSKDFCYKDTDNAGKYCWYPTDAVPCPGGQWKGEGGHGYHDCGRKCTEVHDFDAPYACVAVIYDPHEDYCFTDIDNAGKYCWNPNYKIPYGNWEFAGSRDFDDCGPGCEY